MKVQSCDCSIVIKTAHRELDIPYSEETLREAFSVLHEEAAIEGDGSCKAIRKRGGVTGCVVTPLTIGTAPLLLYLAMGAAGVPVFISETRNLYRYELCLLPMKACNYFDLIQGRLMNNERKLYENCRVNGFELRIERGQTIKLKLDICSEWPPVVYPHDDTFESSTGERFSGDCVKYEINGKEYTNIYGLTLSTKKENSTKTEIWIRRVLETEPDIPDIIEELNITAQLLRSKYEERHFGTFRITAKRLVLTADGTSVNSSGAVIGPLRYYVSGNITAEAFTSSEDSIA